MLYAGGRVLVDPSKLESSPAVLPVVFVGHCPGRVDTDLLKREEIVTDISRLGYSERARAISGGADEELYHLPVPVRSVDEFAAIFPNAREEQADYHTPLGGTHAWLPEQVEDFFANGGQKLWIVRVPQSKSRAAGIDAFGLNIGVRLRRPESLRGIGAALAVDEAGVIALPDHERLRIPDLADPDALEPAPPEPVFAPCADSEVNASSDDVAEPNATEEDDIRREELGYVGRLAAMLRKHRPDAVVLHTLPLSHENRLAGPGVSWPVIDGLTRLRNSEDGYAMKRIQLLFPFLRGTGGTLRSPVGTIAGRQAATAAARGVWSSIAGEDLFTSARPYPALNRQVVLKLRDEPGVGILRTADTGVRIDDERLMVPALHRDDYPRSSAESYSGYRSAEVMRFIGFLLRKLTELGDALVFKIEPRDPLPRLVLNQFFMSLFRLGALRGRSPDQAFRIHEMPPVNNALGFDIEVAPAFPVDRIQITFANLSGQWQATVGHG